MITTLAGRLFLGWLMVDREPDPVRREQLEDFWIDLLHQYETACDALSCPDQASAPPGDRPSRPSGHPTCIDPSKEAA